MDEYIVKYFTSDANGLRLFMRLADGASEKGKANAQNMRDYVADIAKKNKGLAYIGKGLEPVQIQTSAIDSSMAALRAFQVRETSRIFGVPVVMLGEEKANTQISALKQDLWHNCVKPHTNTMLAAMTTKLLNRGSGPKGHRFAVDPMEMFKGDPEFIAKLLPALGTAQQPGFMLPSEMRGVTGLPKAMPEMTDTDKQFFENLKECQAGLPSGGRPAEINTGNKEPNDDDQGDED